MGRHLWNIFKPKFLIKLIRSRAYSIYKWNILFSGTLWPGKNIAKNLGFIIRKTLKYGHEIGLHSWDHYSWQVNIDNWSQKKIRKQIFLGLQALEKEMGKSVQCSAVPSWKADEKVIKEKENFKFIYNSDCRGREPFFPLFSNGKVSKIIQIPVNLPTYDETVGLLVGEKEYNYFIFDLIKKSNVIPVYTIHAEVEGVSRLLQFEKLLQIMVQKDIKFCSLSELIPKNKQSVSIKKVIRSYLPGRYGWVGMCQQ